NPKRTFLDLHFHVSAFLRDPAHRKARETIVDFERDTSLRRSERVGDPRLRIEGAKIVEDCLVRDLSRQANVLRRDPASRWAHEGPTPMRWRAGDMGHATRASADQKVPHRLLGARYHQRRSAEECAQENLQAAVPAYVVERAPRPPASRPASLDRS